MPIRSGGGGVGRANGKARAGAEYVHMRVTGAARQLQPWLARHVRPGLRGGWPFGVCHGPSSRSGRASAFEGRLVLGKELQPRNQARIGRTPINLLAPVEIAERAGQTDRYHVGFAGIGQLRLEGSEPAVDLAALMRQPFLRRRLAGPEAAVVDDKDRSIHDAVGKPRPRQSLVAVGAAPGAEP